MSGCSVGIKHKEGSSLLPRHSPGTGIGRKTRSLEGQTGHTLAVLVGEYRWESLLFGFLGPQVEAVRLVLLELEIEGRIQHTCFRPGVFFQSCL